MLSISLGKMSNGIVIWYSDYEDVKIIEKFMRECDTEDYGFIRVGEETDIEILGDCSEYSLNTSTTIDSPLAEEISDKDFFAPNSIKFIKED